MRSRIFCGKIPVRPRNVAASWNYLPVFIEFPEILATELGRDFVMAHPSRFTNRLEDRMFRRPVKALRIAVFAVLLFTGWTTTAVAAPFGFASAAGGGLYTIDFGAGSATLIGNTGQSLMESLAINGAGQLFGANSGGILFSINTATAAATMIGNTGLGNIEALDFNGNTLLGSNFSATPTVYSFNTSTAAATSVATASIATGAVRSGALLTANTMFLFGDGTGGCTLQCLYQINLTTGATVLLGQPSGPGATSIISGLDLASDGLFYGVNTGGTIFSFNGMTGVTTAKGESGVFFLGLATPAAAVPEPATLLLVATGLGAAVRRRTALKRARS